MVPSLSGASDPLLAVNVKILDYLLYAGTQALVEERQARSADPNTPIANTDSALLAVDAFLKIFKANHAAVDLPTRISFRLQLLKVTTLFVRRYTNGRSTPPLQVLQTMRHENEVNFWLHKHTLAPDVSFTSRENQLPLPGRIRHSHSVTVLKAVNVCCPPIMFYGTERCVSLFDLLPLFLSLTAAVTVDYGMTDTAMELAAEWMLQAALEQYLVYGKDAVEFAPGDAFAWGKLAEDARANNWDEECISVMFTDGESGKEIAGWSAICQAYAQELIPLPDSEDTLAKHLTALAEQYPIAKFEETVLGYLKAMHSSTIALPELEDLENNSIPGLTFEQQHKLRRQIGFAT